MSSTTLLKKLIKNFRSLRKDIRKKKRENFKEKKDKEEKFKIKRTKSKNLFVFKMLSSTFRMSISLGKRLEEEKRKRKRNDFHQFCIFL